MCTCSGEFLEGLLKNIVFNSVSSDMNYNVFITIYNEISALIITLLFLSARVTRRGSKDNP